MDKLVRELKTTLLLITPKTKGLTGLVVTPRFTPFVRCTVKKCHVDAPVSRDPNTYRNKRFE